MQTIKKLLFLLNPKERRSSGLLLLMIIIMAIIDMIGVASILPFMAVISNPSLIETNIILKNMFQIFSKFGVQNDYEFLLALGVLLFLILLFSLSFKALTTYAQLKFTQMREFSISKRFIESYLQQPYSWFLDRHSSDLGKTILSEIGGIVGGGIKPLLDLISKGIVTTLLIILLLLTDPKLTIIISITLSTVYLLIFFSIKKYLKRIGKKRFKNNELRFTSVSEAFGALKEIKVGGLEQTYVKKFSDAAKIYAKAQASSSLLSQLPRFFLEAIAFGGILLIILYLMTTSGSFNNAIPIISLYVFAGYRLLPAIQQIYRSFTQLTFIGPAIDRLYEEKKNLKTFVEDYKQSSLNLNDKIFLNDICYNYPNTSRTALKDINIIIPSKTTVGLIGPTGSGKTTMVDIILGILEPQKGTLEIDGKIITKQNCRSWQKTIDQDVVEKVCKIANLDKFVIEELPKKYLTKVGERGIRLSGGQRQRIGIARALYHNPKVLILDEATSALDNQTEKSVMEAVNNIGNDITVILITHRLNTVRNCNMIFKLENGRIIDQGTYEEIIHQKK
jgi:ABC-type bacteriocin/lantibiotic exporter with double-glycine peptidase domain